MLANLPDETTELLIDICTGATSSAESESPTAVNGNTVAAPTPSYLSYLALSRAGVPAQIADGLPTSSATTTTEAPQPNVVPQRPSRQRTGSFHDTPRTGSPVPPSILAVKPRVEKWPSPRQYFSHFVDNMDKFVVFLETVAHRRWKQSVDGGAALPVTNGEPVSLPADPQADMEDQIAVWNTLLEMYLTLCEDGQASSDKKKVLRGKALTILKSDRIPYDPTHALLLCSTRNFTDGLVLLWERLGMYEDVLRFWIDKENEGNTPGASANVVQNLRLYGSKHKLLYPLVLRFLTSNEALLSKHADDLKEILEEIEREKVMPPLGVIQVLSRNGVTSVGLMKEWLLSRVKTSREEIQTVSGDGSLLPF